MVTLPVEPTWTVVLEDIEIAVTTKPVKHLRLVVHPDGRIRASVPRRTSRRDTEAFLRDRLAWVRRQQARLGVCGPARPLSDGDRLPLWGDDMTVHLTRGRRGARPTAVNRLTISVTDPTDTAAVDEAVMAMYRREIRTVLPDFVDKWATRLGQAPSRLTVRAMRTRWGSCTTTTGAIRINPELAARHPRCLDYVVLHEMVHLLEPGHGPGFQAMMDAYLPNWRAVRAELNAGHG